VPLGSRAALDDGPRRFDVVVIGGGINGAGIARAAARAGLRVCLFEKYDFGWGTTWRSTKLIHGGLRYLEHGELGLVFESLHDQALLLREYPDMVRPLSLLLPIYRGARRGVTTIGLGLTIYDLLARGRHLPGHRRLAAGTALAMEPALRARGLTAAFTYSDSQIAFPERLCIQTLLEAAEAGAVCLNRAEVTGIQRHNGRVAGVTVRDDLLHRHVEVGARVVVNASGPWVDELLATLSTRPRRQLGGTRGAHVVVDYAGRGPLHGLYAEARSDRRPFFIVPWRGRHLIGTTDTRYAGPPEAAAATRADVDYLLSEANALLPGAPLVDGAVEYAYAGVRPLPASTGGAEGSVTRRHLIRDHADSGYDGLFSIIGGKLSTYRSLADDVLRQIGRYVWPTPSQEAPRPRHETPAAQEAAAETRWLLQRAGPAIADHLRATYGPRLHALAALTHRQPALIEPLCPHGPDLVGQVVLAARTEAAHGVADVLLRRLSSGWNICLGLDCAERVATLLGMEHGWSAERVTQQAAAYVAEVRATFFTPGRALDAAPVPARSIV
jgi:glycerol-3-phosphate dehydrogenase